MEIPDIEESFEESLEMHSEPALCSFKGLELSFPDSKGTERPLNLPDLDFLPSSLSVVTGPNGIGKSSLLRSFWGAGPIKRGRILSRIPLEQVGWVGQDFVLGRSVFPCSVTEFLERSWRLKFSVFSGSGRPSKDYFQKQLKKYGEALGVDQYANTSLNRLSVGQWQRLALLRSLVLEPRIFLLDEPFSALDRKSKQQAIQLLREFVAERRAAVIAVLHDVVDILELLLPRPSLSGRVIDLDCGSQGEVHVYTARDLKSHWVERTRRVRSESPSAEAF